jgi:hypothetical protein
MERKVAKASAEKNSKRPRRAPAPRQLDHLCSKPRELLSGYQKFESPIPIATYPDRLLRARRVQRCPSLTLKPPFTSSKNNSEPGPPSCTAFGRRARAEGAPSGPVSSDSRRVPRVPGAGPRRNLQHGRGFVSFEAWREGLRGKGSRSGLGFFFFSLRARRN